MHAYAVFPKRCIKSHPPPVLDSSIKKQLKLVHTFSNLSFSPNHQSNTRIKENGNKNNIRNKTEMTKEINKLYARLCSNSN